MALADLAIAHRVGAYLASDGEPDLASAMPQLWRRGVEVLVPIVEGEAMRFAPLRPTTPIVTNRWGIAEPATPVRVAPGALDVVLVPLVGFDPAGHRLGRGAGYYDRAFAATPRPPLIGVAYELQRVEALVPADHDVPLDLVVTERTVHRCTTATPLPCSAVGQTVSMR